LRHVKQSKIKVMKAMQIELQDNGYDTIPNMFLSDNTSFVYTRCYDKAGGIFIGRLSLKTLCSQECIDAFFRVVKLESIEEYCEKIIANYIGFTSLSISVEKIKAFRKAKKFILENRKIQSCYGGWDPVRIRTWEELDQNVNDLLR
jgi:hypothetical protein